MSSRGEKEPKVQAARKAVVFGLSLKFIVYSSIIVALATGSIGFFLLDYHRTQMWLLLEQRCETQVFNAARDLARVWGEGNRGKQQLVLQSVLAQQQVQYVCVFDSLGTLIARGGAAPESITPPSRRSRALGTTAFSKSFNSAGKPILEAEYPVIRPSNETDNKEQVIGYVRLGVSAEQLRQSFQRAFKATMAISVTVAIISILLIALIVSRIVTPLGHLARAATALSEGDLTTRVPALSGDEVGELARAFNAMVEKLRESRAELEKLWAAKERSKMENVAECLVDALIVISLEGTVLLANNPARELFSLTTDEEAELQVLHLGETKLAEFVSPVLSGEMELVTESIHYGRPRMRLVQISVSPMKGLQGEIQAAIALIRDVTRESEMSQQLLHSEKLAAIGQLASGVAHEVNNPLTVISGFAEMLRRKVKDPDLHRLIDKIALQATRCGEIVTSLSRFSRKSSGQRSVCDLNQLVKETASLLLSQLSKVDVMLVLTLCEKNAKVLANANEMQQVIFNLINNARDAMPKGGTITITTHVDDDAVSLQVSDTGMGIAGDDLSSIFAPFYTTKDPGKGTGLGLPVCSTIVNDHGGTISVESELGEGTSFKIILPLSQEMVKEDKDKNQTVSVQIEPSLALVVDDEEDITYLCRHLFADMGIDVDVHNDPHEARELARNKVFGLYLFDVRMPGLSGYKLVEELRNQGDDTPVLFMTGLLDERDKKGDHSIYEPCDTLPKPFDVDMLAMAIRNLVKSKASS